jgi:hypothetical protein
MDSVSTISSEKATLALLQAENASLRAELKFLRENKPQQTPHSDPTCHFFRLPREIRNAIYELCVVPGTIFISRPGYIPYLRDLDMRYTDRRRDTEPVETQLFLISREIRLEALEVFLSMNQFVISTPNAEHHNKYPHTITSRIPGGQDHPLLLTRHLRSISLSLNSIENAPNEIMLKHVNITCDSHNYAEDTVEDPEAEAWDAEVRTIQHADLTERLASRFSIALKKVFAFPGALRRIQINLEATVCPLGCHRLVEYLFERKVRRVSMFGNGDALEAVDFLGTVSDEERDAVLAVFPDDFRDKVTFYGSYYWPGCGFNPMDEVHTPSM